MLIFKFRSKKRRVFCEFNMDFGLQNGLLMDENTCTQAMKLFKETKHLLQTNISAIGNGTVCFIGLFCIVNVKIR